MALDRLNERTGRRSVFARRVRPDLARCYACAAAIFALLRAFRFRAKPIITARADRNESQDEMN